MDWITVLFHTIVTNYMNDGSIPVTHEATAVRQ